MINNTESFEVFTRLLDNAIFSPAAVTPSFPYSPILTGDSGKEHFTSVRSTSFPGYMVMVLLGVHPESITFKQNVEHKFSDSAHVIYRLICHQVASSVLT